MQKNSISGAEAHESTLFWKERSEKIWLKNLHHMIEKPPFGKHPFYVFMIIKRVNDLMGEKKCIFQPRLTKPLPVPGTTLLKLYPERDEVKIIWTLPNEAEFPLFGFGKMYQDLFVHWCIEQYINNPEMLARPEPDDLPDEKIREIYKDNPLSPR